MSDEDKIRSIVRDAVTETLSRFGIDIQDPREMQADFAYMRKSRKGAEFVSSKIKGVFITIVVTGFLYLVWDIIKNLR